ncbi:DUF4394 domain-containing protein, partial [Streptomyces massasporeus]
NTTDARALKVSQLTVALAGSAFGVDFNPAANRLRVISDTGQNLRHNIDDAAAPLTTTVDGTLTNPTMPPSTAMGVTGAAYTNNDLNAATATTLFDLDTMADRISLQSPANAGTLAPTGNLGVDAARDAGFDISYDPATGMNHGFATIAAGGSYRLHSVDLLTGRATSRGAFPTRSGPTLGGAARSGPTPDGAARSGPTPDGAARSGPAQGGAASVPVDLVVACGGDGTVRACADVVAGTGIALAVVPCGTGNLLARNLGLPLDPATALEEALGGDCFGIDLGRVRGDRLRPTRFTVMAGAGFDAAMVRDASPRLKARLGWVNEFYVLDQLLVEEDGVKKSAGVVAYELATGEIHVFQAKSVIYASGGTGKFFKVTSNAHTLTGDGQAACYRRGLPLEDMEFFQFHPTGIWRMGILLTEGARGEGG